MRYQNLLASFVFAALLVLAGTANAFVQTMTCTSSGQYACDVGEEPKPVYWPERCVNYHINEQGSSDVDNDTAFNAIIDSFESWNEVSCSYITFNFAGMTNEDLVRYDPRSGKNANVIMFRDTGWRGQARVLALTSVTFQPSTGKIFDADIEFNTQLHSFTTTDRSADIKIDLANTATHEIGHFLGLDHSLDEGSTMFSTAPLGENQKRTLEADDEAGICSIYPNEIDPGGSCAGGALGFYEKPPETEGDISGENSNCSIAGPSAPARGGLLAVAMTVLLGTAVYFRRRL